MPTLLRASCLGLVLLTSGCQQPGDRFDEGGLGHAFDAGWRADGDGTFPCEVERIVTTRCQGCHGPNASAPVRLRTPRDFEQRAVTDLTTTVAWQSLARMRDAARPMPPTGLLDDAELRVMEMWVLEGVPSGVACSAADGGPVVTPSDAGPGDGLPCDVDALLAQRCRSCHGVPLSAPMPLIAREHLTRTNPANASETIAAASLRRMQDSARPMPPSGLVAPGEVAVLAAWVSSGMPVGRCGTGPVDAGPNPFDVPAKCTSGQSWAGKEDEGDPRMNPGRACVACHRLENAGEGEEKGPAGVGGTVYPSAHEPNLCNGGPQGVVVVLTGADGGVVRLTANSVGNFYASERVPLAKPYRARLEWQGRVREMATPQMSGDCNACHTQAGASGAPGRILAP